MKILSEAQMGVDFGHFRGTSWVEIKNLFEKMTKLSYKLKLIVSKLFRKVISTLYNCNKRIKQVIISLGAS